MAILIADSGSTKCEWCFISNGRKQLVETQGASPYFLNEPQLVAMMQQELLPALSKKTPSHVYFYGTGCAAAENRAMIRRAILKIFPKAGIEVEHDLTGAARALCGKNKGIVAILGTGSNSGYYNGKKILRNSPGLGYILGDEGSGAYLGKKVLQYYLYKTFDAELNDAFHKKYQVTTAGILEAVYKKPLPNRYIASFALFLAENRGHYMIENIIEDGLWDFFSVHLAHYPESGKIPIHFTGSVAFGFQDILKELCNNFGWEAGEFLAKPMQGLITYHKRR
ncbi:MAG TPA: N-acetylglucosamine kinase [Chitinophagaceae bacterium]|jgi:glucosamine kinase|nr:N-acetylglucosamine kinase [Chitinophagaceae bacterium]